MFLLGSGSHEGKSPLAKWYEKVSGTTHKIKDHAKSGALAAAQSGEGLVVGGVLGAADAQFGLDHNIQGHQVPLDAVAAGALTVGAAIVGADPVASFAMRNAAAACASVWGYRMGHKFVAGKKAGQTKSTTAHGEFGAEDPIIAAARALR